MAAAKDPIIVYTIGKSGSTSVVDTLNAAGGRPAWQMHRLHAEVVDGREWEVESQRPWHVPRHLWAAQHFRDRLPTPVHPWDVITITRDPLAQSVSSFFQSAIRRRYVDEDPRRILDTYLARHDVFRALDWFDDEIKKFLNVDIYEYPLTRGEPLLVQTPSVRLMLLRREDLDRVGPAALSAFAGVTVSQMQHANIGANKAYAHAYQRFRAAAELPRELVDRMYESRYARHFYSPDEIARFRSAWRTA